MIARSLHVTAGATSTGGSSTGSSTRSRSSATSRAARCSRATSKRRAPISRRSSIQRARRRYRRALRHAIARSRSGRPVESASVSCSRVPGRVDERANSADARPYHERRPLRDADVTGSRSTSSHGLRNVTENARASEPRAAQRHARRVLRRDHPSRLRDRASTTRSASPTTRSSAAIARAAHVHRVLDDDPRTSAHRRARAARPVCPNCGAALA